MLFRSKMKSGAIYKADVTAPRNIKFHRKTFALLNLTFGFWEPDTLISQVEVETVDKFRRYMAIHGITSEAIDALCHGFVKHIEQDRQHYNVDKCFESFREWITIKSGYYNVVRTPSGLKKVAKSISFAAMDGCDFDSYYRALLSACWELALHRVYENQEQLANELLRFE